MVLVLKCVVVKARLRVHAELRCRRGYLCSTCEMSAALRRFVNACVRAALSSAEIAASSVGS